MARVLSMFVLGAWIIFAQCAPESAIHQPYNHLDDIEEDYSELGKEPQPYALDPKSRKLKQGLLTGSIEFPIYFDEGKLGQGVGATFDLKSRILSEFVKDPDLYAKYHALKGKSILFVIDSYYPHTQPTLYLDKGINIEKYMKEQLKNYKEKFDFVFYTPIPTKGMLYVNSDFTKSEWDELIESEGRRNIGEFFEIFTPSFSQKFNSFDPIASINKEFVHFKVDKRDRVFEVPIARFLQKLVADGMIKGEKSIDYTVPELFRYSLSFNDLGQSVFINEVILPSIETALRQLQLEEREKNGNQVGSNSFMESQDSIFLRPLKIDQGIYNLKWKRRNQKTLFFSENAFFHKHRGKYQIQIEDKMKFIKSAKIYYENRTYTIEQDVFPAIVKNTVLRDLNKYDLDFTIDLLNESSMKINMKRALNSISTPLTLEPKKSKNPNKVRYEAFVSKMMLGKKPRLFNYHLILEQSLGNSRQYKLILDVYPQLKNQPSIMSNQTLNIQYVDEIRKNGRKYPKIRFSGFGRFTSGR